MQLSRPSPRIIILSFLFLIFLGLCGKAEGQVKEPRGEIRVVDNWRPDINVLGHNVLQYLYEYALDRNELVPCLAVSRSWVDETTLELKLREGCGFTLEMTTLGKMKIGGWLLCLNQRFFLK
jgi:hypothetical protein